MKDIEYPELHVKMESNKIGTMRMGQGLVRLILDVEEIEKLNWMAKTLNKTLDETVEMIVRAHLMGITIKDE